MVDRSRAVDRGWYFAWPRTPRPRPKAERTAGRCMVSEGARRVGIEVLGGKLSMVSIKKKLERALSPREKKSKSSRVLIGLLAG